MCFSMLEMSLQLPKGNKPLPSDKAALIDGKG